MSTEYPTQELWDRRLERFYHEALDRLYYEDLDRQEALREICVANAKLQLQVQNLTLSEQLKDGKRVVSEYMQSEEDRTDQCNHLAKQAVRLHKENEDLKKDYALLFESNKQCAQSNIDLHEQIETLKYKLKCLEEDTAKKLTAWANGHTMLTKEKGKLSDQVEQLKQMVEHLRERNIDLDKQIGSLDSQLYQSDHCKDIADRQVIKLQASDAAFRKSIDFYRNMVALCKNTLISLSYISWFRPLGKKDRTTISDTINTIIVYQGQIDRELDELRKNIQPT